jgi:LPXTG-site transpeptidase (sortase) family protein
MKRFQRPILIVILITGIAMALWPAGEHVYGWWNQRALHAAWQDMANAHTLSNASYPQHDGQQGKAGRNDATGAPTSIKLLEGTFRKAAFKPKSRTWAPTKILIPDIHLDVVVVPGITPDKLRQGPGHDPASALPGEKGNCVIAAHRNAYGWWFYRLDRIEVDSVVQLQTPHELLTYRVALNRVVDEDDLSLLQPADSAQLTLYTCTLPKSDQRIVVVADLVARQPS